MASSRPVTHGKLHNCVRGASFLALAKRYRGTLRLGRLLGGRRPRLLFVSVRVPCVGNVSFLDNVRGPPGIVVASTCRRCTLGKCRLGMASCLLGPVSFSHFLGTIGEIRRLLRGRRRSAPRPCLFMGASGLLGGIAVRSVLFVRDVNGCMLVRASSSGRVACSPLGDLLRFLPSGLFVRMRHSCVIRADGVRTVRKGVLVVKVRGVPVTHDLHSRMLGTLLGSGLVSQ